MNYCNVCKCCIWVIIKQKMTCFVKDTASLNCMLLKYQHLHFTHYKITKTTQKKTQGISSLFKIPAVYLVVQTIHTYFFFTQGGDGLVSLTFTKKFILYKLVRTWKQLQFNLCCVFLIDTTIS